MEKNIKVVKQDVRKKEAPCLKLRSADLKVSVVMPTYNGARYVALALGSLCTQGNSVYQVVVVDDGSTDETVAIVDSFRERLPIELHRSAHTGNWVANTNQALELVRGDVVCMLHQDDLWMPGRLERILDTFRRDAICDVVFHPARFVGPNGEALGTLRSAFASTEGLIQKDKLVQNLIVQNFIAIPTPAVRLSALRRVGGLDEELWFTADWDLWMRLAEVVQWSYISEPLAAFRIHWESQTLAANKSIEEYGEQYRIVQGRFIGRIPGSPREIRLLQAISEVSTELNVSLLQLVRERRLPNLPLTFRAISLWPKGWVRLLSASRIHERVFARLLLALQR